MAKLSTLAEQLAAIKASQDEARAEIRQRIDGLVARIDELEQSLGDVEIPQASQTLIDELKAGAKELADIVPNEGGTGDGEPTP